MPPKSFQFPQRRAGMRGSTAFANRSSPIARAVIIIDTLHPVHEGRAFFWRRDAGQAQTKLVEYGPTSEGEAAENWHRSVLSCRWTLLSAILDELKMKERTEMKQLFASAISLALLAAAPANA